MKLYTSYFAKLRSIDNNKYEVISICGKAPSWYTGKQYKKLAPKYDFFIKWKENKDNNYYIEHFNKEVLELLDVHEVVNELLVLSDNKDVVLVCYEKPTDFCHRHLVSDWLTKNGYNCEELNV